MSEQVLPRRFRLEFAKTGKARFISHLDLMRTFQRAIMRAELPAYHTEGFNPHVYIAIAMPLPLGCEGMRELADIELSADAGSGEEMTRRINAVLPEGIEVSRIYEPQTPLKKIGYARYETTFYIDGPADEALSGMKEKLGSEHIYILKRQEKEGKMTDIKPLIHSATFIPGEGFVRINSVVRCSASGSLNPLYLAQAVKNDEADSKEVLYKRVGFLAEDQSVFE